MPLVKITAKWPNPWADRLVLVPVEALALAVTTTCYNPNHPERARERFLRYVERDFDAYLLQHTPPLPHNGPLSAGFRYGPGEDQYLSPMVDQHLAGLLWGIYHVG